MFIRDMMQESYFLETIFSD